MHAESIAKRKPAFQLIKRRFSDDATHGQICRSRESAAVRTATRIVAREAEQTHSLLTCASTRLITVSGHMIHADQKFCGLKIFLSFLKG